MRRLSLYFSRALGYWAVLVACSSPTKISVTDQILIHMLKTSEFESPIQTPENSTNEGFLETRERVNVLINELNKYKGMITPFVEEDIKATRTGDSFQWQRFIDGDESQEVVLTVTNGDTLIFRIEYTRHSNAFYYEGKVYSNHSSGWIESGTGGWGVSWSSQGDVNRLSSHGSIGGDFMGFRSAMTDSINGGGTYEASDGMVTWFEANWDAIGHGSWVYLGHSSGDW